MTVSILEKCGFLINIEKFIDLPSQIIEYLDLIINSRRLALFLRKEKITEISELCRNDRHQASVSLREIARILGDLTWAIKAIPYAQAHYKSLQSQYIKGCKQSGDSLDSAIVLDSYSKDNFAWWIANVGNLNGRPMSASDPDLVIYSDASLSGWGPF